MEGCIDIICVISSETFFLKKVKLEKEPVERILHNNESEYELEVAIVRYFLIMKSSL